MRMMANVRPVAAFTAFTASFAAAFVATLVACGSTTSNETDGSADISAGRDGATAMTCPVCTTDDDCAGGVCAQLGGDTFCVPTCPNGKRCASNRACMSVTTVDGQQTNACVERAKGCGDGTIGTQASSPPPSTSTCGTLVGPDVTATCHSCGPGTCQSNGCFGGWWCNTASNKCQSAPANCSTGDGGAASVDAGTVSGTVSTTGGSVSRLYFAVVGDTRPPAINDTAAYPSSIIKAVYGDIEASSPRPSFVVATGDYIFASPTSSNAAAQFDLYLAARKQYSGVLFPAMGNHECSGFTASNCGPGNPDGITKNYSAFLDKLLAPVGQTTPNYVVSINGSDGSWTSKFVFVAGNSWSASDTTWLEGVLSKPTTYTFIVRHEPKAASTAPGCAASEAVMSRHPYTLAIVGHTHTYDRSGPRQVTIGNGGAPLVSGTNYGFGLINQRDDGAIQVDVIDYATGKPDLGFRFAVHPDGSPAP